MMDEYPQALAKRRELFVLGLITVCFLGSLSTLTYVSTARGRLGAVRFSLSQICPRNRARGRAHRCPFRASCHPRCCCRAAPTW